MKRTFRLAGMSALPLAAFVALSACGSSASSTSKTDSGSAAKLTGTPVTIGVIASETGPQASSNSQGATVAPAWAKYVNNQLGGINGHPVQVVVKDDGGDPAKAQAAAKSLAADPSDVAIVIGADNVLPAYVDDLRAAKIPVVSGTGNTVPWYSDSGLFPTTTDTVSGVRAQVDVAKQFAKSTVFAQAYCAEVAQCAQANPIIQGEATKLGMKFVPLSVSATSTSYTAQCLQLQQSKADYVQLNIASAVGAKLIADCQAQNYNPTWGTSEQAIGKDLLSVPDVTAYGPAFAFPSVADTKPVATFRDAMTKYASGSDWREGAGSYTWQGLEIIRTALSQPGVSPSRAGVFDGLYALKGETLGGLLANALTFSRTKPVAFGSQPCYFLVGIKGGKTVAPNGLTPVCVKP